jgi:hypothetical protein
MAAAWYALIPFAVYGGVVMRRRRITLIPVVATLVVVIVSVALIWGTPRFRLPVDVVAIVLAAVAIDALLTRTSAEPEPVTAEPVTA